MGTVRAKFKCASITEYEGGNKEVKLSAVSGKGSEDFSKYTPSGDFRMYITPETTANTYFKPGCVYSILIEELAETV